MKNLPNITSTQTHPKTTNQDALGWVESYRRGEISFTELSEKLEARNDEMTQRAASPSEGTEKI